MKNNSIDKKEIERLLPHREPMLLIDRLINIVPLKSATAIVNVKKTSFFVQGHFPGQPVMPGVFIVEAFGQAAAALTAHSVDSKETENKLVYLMKIDLILAIETSSTICSVAVIEKEHTLSVVEK